MALDKDDIVAFAMFAAVRALIEYYRTLDPLSDEYNSKLAGYVRHIVEVWDYYPKQMQQ